jgi:hypothetical protein
MQLAVLGGGGGSTYTSWPVRTKWKISMINTETIRVIGRNLKGNNSLF